MRIDIGFRVKHNDPWKWPERFYFGKSDEIIDKESDEFECYGKWIKK